MTFDERTELRYMERIYIMDSYGSYERYQYDDLAGRTIEVKGDTVRIYASLCSYYDDYYGWEYGWGFKVSNITGVLSQTPTVSPETPESSAMPTVSPTQLPTITQPVTVIHKLKSKKRYYIKVRAYKTNENNKKIYGKYSAVKSKKTK